MLRELYRSMVAKRKLSNTAKLSFLKKAFISILTYGHESWVITERVLSEVQAVKMGFLRRAHGETLRDKLPSCEFINPWKQTLLFPNREIPTTMV